MTRSSPSRGTSPVGRTACSLGKEALANLDAAFSGNAVDGAQLERAEMLMWFWTLGAYEVIRTMSQARRGFTPELVAQLSSLKRELAQARMPAAKMEKAGKKHPVTSSRSPADGDPRNQDLLIGDPTTSMNSSRRLLTRFEDVVSRITPADVLEKHEDSYDRKA